MTKTTKILLIALVVIAIGAAVFLLWKKKKTEDEKAAAISDDPNDFSQNNIVNGGGGSGNSGVPKTATPTYTSPSSGLFTNLFSGVNNAIANLIGSGGNTQELTGTKIGSALMATGGGATAISAAVARQSNFPLKQGSKGAEVKVIQRAANLSIGWGQIKAARLVEDGIWGAKTTAAVKQFYPSAQISYNQYKTISDRVTLGLGFQ